MRLLRLIPVGFILLVLLFAYGCVSSGTTITPTPTAVPTPTNGSTPTLAPSTGPTDLTIVPGPTFTTGSTPKSSEVLIVNSTLPKLKIETDIPTMQVNQQVVVEVSIYPTGGPMSISDVRTVENATAVVTGATPVGTPGYTLVNAFGPNQSVVATATLETSSNIFSITPTGPQPKPLNQDRVVWSWFVTPLVAGAQVIGVDIEVQWTSTLSGKQSSPYTLGFPKYRVSIQSVSTLPPPGLSDATATIIASVIGGIALVLATFITALFAIPGFRKWIVAHLPERGKKPPTNQNTLP